MKPLYVILASHGNFCSALKDSVSLLIGQHDNLIAVPLDLSKNPEEYENDMRQVLQKLKGERIICLVDILGGTPSNTLLKLTREFDFELVSGFNLPALIFLLTEGQELDGEELATKTVEAIQDSAIDLMAKLRKLKKDSQK